MLSLFQAPLQNRVPDGLLWGNQLPSVLIPTCPDPSEMSPYKSLMSDELQFDLSTHTLNLFFSTIMKLYQKDSGQAGMTPTENQQEPKIDRSQKTVRRIIISSCRRRPFEIRFKRNLRPANGITGESAMKRCLRGRR